MDDARRDPSGNLPENASGMLYLCARLACDRGVLRCLLLKSGLPFCDPADEVLAVQVSPAGLARLRSLFLRTLSEAQMMNCTAVLVEDEVFGGTGLPPRMGDLLVFVRGVREDNLAAARPIG